MAMIKSGHAARTAEVLASSGSDFVGVYVCETAFVNTAVYKAHAYGDAQVANKKKLGCDRILWPSAH